MPPELAPELAAELALVVNGEPRRFDATGPEGLTVRELLAALDLAGRRVAVAVNGDVVPRSRFAARALRDGDRVEVIQAVGGG